MPSPNRHFSRPFVIGLAAAVALPTLGAAHVLTPDTAETYPVLRCPVDVAVSPDGATAVVACREASDLALVDLATSTFRNVPAAAYGGDHPVRAAFVQDRLLVVNLYSPFVTEVDVAAGTVVAQHPVPQYCTDILVDEAAGRIYLTNRWLDEVLVYDLAMSPVAADPGIRVGENPGRMAIGADGYLYVGNDASWDVSIVDLATENVVHTVYFGSAPTGMARVGDHVLATSHGGDTLPRINGAPMILNDQADIINIVTWIHQGDFTVQQTWLDLGADYMDLQSGSGLVAFTGAGGGTVHIWRETDPVGQIQTIDLLDPVWGLPGGRAPSGLRIFSNTRAVAIVDASTLVAVNYFRDSLVRMDWSVADGAFQVTSETALNVAGDAITAFQDVGTNMTVRQSGERYLNTLAAWFRDQDDFTCATCHVDGNSDFRFIFDQDLDPHDATKPSQGPERHPTIQGAALTAPFGWEGQALTLGEFNMLALNAHDLPTGSSQVHGDVARDFLPFFEAALLPDPSPYEQPTYDPAAPNAAERGRALFLGEADCASCHGSAAFMDNSLHDVGTGRLLVTPTLLGLWDRRPLLHDGRAPTLLDLLDPGVYDAPATGIEPHGDLAALDAAEKADLVAFLLSIQTDTRLDPIPDLPELPGGPGGPESGLQLTIGPNPAVGQVSLEYTLPAAGSVRLAVFDLKGRLVRLLVDGAAEASGTVVWDGRSTDGRAVSAGVYWADLATRDDRTTGRIVFLR